MTLTPIERIPPDDRRIESGHRFLTSLNAQVGSEMARRISSFAWGDSSVGAPGDWPASLKAMVRMALSTRHPVFIFWGPEHLCFYNDAYRTSLGPEKHPAILGMPGERAWPEIWPIIGPQIGLVMRGEGATWHENQLVPIFRHGSLQDVYWTYSYGPIDDETADTGVGGVLVLVTETTRQVLEERQSRSDRERLSALFDRAPTFMALLRGPDHVFELTNPSFMRLVGGRPLLGRRVVDAMPEVADQGDVDLLDRVYRTGQAFSALGAKLRLRTAVQSGRDEQRFVDFVCEPMLAADGSVTGIFVVGSDVTERMNAELALALKEEQLRLATDSADVGLWDLDMTSGTLFWPARVKAMFGISEQVPVTMDDFYRGLHPDDREMTAQAFDAAVDPARRWVYDAEYRTVGREDGVVRWVAARGRALFDASGTCIRVIGTALDVSQRKAAERRLLELNETLERRVAESLAEQKILADVVEGTDAFIQVVGLDFRWLAVNRASAQDFFRVFGVEPKVGDDMLELLQSQPEHQAAVRALWQRALTGESFTTIQAFGGPGDRRDHEMRFAGLRNRSGELMGAYQFVYDVTERLREQDRLATAEAALRQAQKMQAVGQLTGGIAHDFNNILQAVRSIFQLIQRKAGHDTAVTSLAARGLSASDRGTKLTAQLLTFSREQAFELRDFSARRQLLDMESLLRTTVGPTVRVAFDFEDGESCVHADAIQLEMAVLNLAINARDAMPSGGDIDIALRRVRLQGDAELADGDYVQLRVTDTGAGMPPEVAARAFDPFFTTKAVGKGSGLGLSQVYGMAQRVGGLARLHTRPGAGTTVELLFLTAADEASGRTLHEDGAGAGVGQQAAERSFKVLVVDDDADVRAALVDTLGLLGHAVLEAEDGFKGLSELEAEEVEFLVVDFAMPRMNGAEFVKRARHLRPDMPVLFVSGYSESAAIDAALGGGTVLLRKPFDMSSLASAMNDALSASRTARHGR